MHCYVGNELMYKKSGGITMLTKSRVLIAALSLTMIFVLVVASTVSAAPPTEKIKYSHSSDCFVSEYSVL
jgi:hypothetical protein